MQLNIKRENNRLLAEVDIKEFASENPDAIGEILRNQIFNAPVNISGYKPLGAYETSILGSDYSEIQPLALPTLLREAVDLQKDGTIGSGATYQDEDEWRATPQAAISKNGDIAVVWWNDGDTIIYIQFDQDILMNNDAKKTYGWELL